jgi:hypothetical protein
LALAERATQVALTVLFQESVLQQLPLLAEGVVVQHRQTLRPVEAVAVVVLAEYPGSPQQMALPAPQAKGTQVQTEKVAEHLGVVVEVVQQKQATPTKQVVVEMGFLHRLLVPPWLAAVAVVVREATSKECSEAVGEAELAEAPTFRRVRAWQIPAAAVVVVTSMEVSLVGLAVPVL